MSPVAPPLACVHAFVCACVFTCLFHWKSYHLGNRRFKELCSAGCRGSRYMSMVANEYQQLFCMQNQAFS